jgi:hypothetical protein
MGVRILWDQEADRAALYDSVTGRLVGIVLDDAELFANARDAALAFLDHLGEQVDARRIASVDLENIWINFKRDLEDAASRDNGTRVLKVQTRLPVFRERGRQIKVRIDDGNPPSRAEEVFVKDALGGRVRGRVVAVVQHMTPREYVAVSVDPDWTTYAA